LDIIEYLKYNEPLVVCSHHDADGISSAVLLTTVFHIDNIKFPEVFGDYARITTETESFDTHVALDLGPPLEEKKFKGIIIDHHPQTKELFKKKFDTKRILYDDVPTSVIVYNLLKDSIPEEEKWKVVCGCVGDGQAEKIPIEIWSMFPELLETRGNIYQSYGKYKEYPYPIYKQLSSPINATCRIGDPLSAYEILLRAKSPFDILHNPAFINDQNLLNEEIKNIFKEGLEELNIRHYLAVVIINSNKKLASRICTSMWSMNSNKTWLVINKGLGDISLRGDQAAYIGTCLQDNGINCGGHYGYFGGELQEGQSEEDILKILRRCLV
jgi:hypothetical protein